MTGQRCGERHRPVRRITKMHLQFGEKLCIRPIAYQRQHLVGAQPFGGRALQMQFERPIGQPIDL